MKKIIALLMVVLICGGLLVGCGSGETPSEQERVDLSKMTANEIAEQLQSHGLPIYNIIVYTEKTDVNKLLGRPNQYTSKVNFADRRIVNQYDIANNPVGGSIEVFSNSTDAKKRKDYIDTIQSTMSVLTQYTYQYDNVLLRIDHELLKEAADEYNTAVKTLYEGNKLEMNSQLSSETSSKVDYASLKSSQQTYSISQSSSSGIYGEYAFEVTNTFDQAVKIEGYTVDFLGDNGTILESDKSVNIVPRVIQPGEKAYCGSTFSVNTTNNPDNIKDMVVHLNGVRAVKSKVELLDFSNLNVLKASGNGLKITGRVENKTSNDISFGSITVVALGENDKLLAAKYIGIDNLKKGDSQTIETTFTNKNLKLDDIKKVIAVGYDFTQI